jgi:hypothetical protein
MFDRRLFLLVATGALVFAGTVVSPAAEQATFTHEGFEAAQKAGATDLGSHYGFLAPDVQRKT